MSLLMAGHPDAAADKVCSRNHHLPHVSIGLHGTAPVLPLPEKRPARVRAFRPEWHGLSHLLNGSASRVQGRVQWTLAAGVLCPPPLPAPQKHCLGNWTYLAKWVESVGEAAVAALARLEETEDVTVRQLRPALQGLLTDEARQAVLPAMCSRGAKVRDVSAAGAVAAKAMWVQWHWAAADAKFMHDDVRMRLPPPLCMNARRAADGARTPPRRASLGERVWQRAYARWVRHHLARPHSQARTRRRGSGGRTPWTWRTCGSTWASGSPPGTGPPRAGACCSTRGAGRRRPSRACGRRCWRPPGGCSASPRRRARWWPRMSRWRR